MGCGIACFDWRGLKIEVKFVNAVTAGGSVKFFASGVNFSKNNAIYNVYEITKYILPCKKTVDLLLD